MKVLILCNDFPPLNSIGAQRPYSWYRHLKQYGIEPIIITKNWKGHSSTPQDVLKNAGNKEIVREETPYGTIIRVPLVISPSEKMLLKGGENYRPVLRRFLTLLYKLLSLLSFRFDVHRNIYFQAKEFLKTEKVDGIIATGEPFILFRYCYLLNRQFQIPWIADYRDGWKLNYVREKQGGTLLKFLIWWEYIFERKYVPSAACITSIDPILASKLSTLLNKTAEVVYNGFDEMYTGPAEPVTNTLPLTLNHSGTLTPAQRVEGLLQAVKELLDEGAITKNEILIRFIGLGYFTDRVKRVTDYDVNVKDTISISPRISREEVLKMNAGADYLVTFSEEKNKMINAKVYDYIAGRRPVIIIPDDESILSGLVKKLQAGYSTKNVGEIKELLLSSIKLKRERKTISPPSLIEKEALFFTREKQAEILATVMKKYFS